MSGIKHIAWALALSALLALCMLMPFLPGTYDGMAVVVFSIAQAVGFGGLLLVPVSIAWLIHEALRLRGRGRSAPLKPRGFFFAITSICIAAPLVALGCLGAFLSGHGTVGLGMLAASAYALARLARLLAGWKQAQSQAFHPAPLYLVIVPLAVLCTRFLFLEQAVAASRNQAIANSAQLIAEIEAFRAERGHYPLSLAALVTDYKPGVIGVRQYEYEPRGSAYSLFFEQIAVPFGTREIVMYNQLDEHVLPSHDSDILLWTPEQLAARPGHYAVHDADRPHWKYIWFD